MNLLFFHGWGFDSSIWDGVIARLPEFACHADDRGYFGPPRAHPAGRDHVAITHSHGTMRALANPAGCRALFAINGFDRFVASADFPGIPARVLARMQARCAGDPAAVLAEFRRRFGVGEAPPACAEPLLRDLKSLAEDDFRGLFSGAMVSLQAADDPLLPAAMRAAVLAGAERIDADHGGHLLPLTRPDLCAEQIRRFVERLA